MDKEPIRPNLPSGFSPGIQGSREAPAAKRSTNSACGRLQDAIVMCRYLCPGWWFQPTPLKNDGVGQLG